MTDEELALHLPGELFETMQLPGDMCVLLTILLDVTGVVDAEEGMLVKEIVEELLNSSNYTALTPEGYFSNCSTASARNAKVKASLEVMNRARINVQPLVEKSERGRNATRYAITDRGERLLELHRRLLVQELQEDSTGANVAPPAMQRGNSLTHENRMSTLQLEQDDPSDEEIDLSGGPSPEYASVELGGGVTHYVMLRCLGAQPPLTYSLLFCPLIFLALNPAHELYAEGMAFWRKRFSSWDNWVGRIGAIFPASDLIFLDIDRGTIPLMFGQPGSRLIPHYTAAAQETTLADAGINHEVDACAQRTFQGAPFAQALSQLPASMLMEQPASEPIGFHSLGASEGAESAFRSLGASEDAEPAFRSLSAPEGTAEPVDSEAATTQDDDSEETWWRSLC